MRIIRTLLFCLTAIITRLSLAAESIFEDGGKCGINQDTLRSGDIRFNSIPCIILNITNNVLSFVGYISLFVILIGALMYIFGGVSEEAKSKGKEAIKLALIGAVVSWSGWLIVNFIFDNF